MRIYGIDFTSTPTRAKPITCAVCTLADQTLTLERMDSFDSLGGFEALLRAPGPWVAGFDFPFAQARQFLAGISWPGVETWEGYVRHVSTRSRAEFRTDLTDYRKDRAPGDRHHRRRVDVRCRSQSPQTIDYTPVGLMFHEGAPRLLAAGVHLPGLRPGDRGRTCVEAYPGIVARDLIGRVSYKADKPARQTETRAEAREHLLTALCGEAGRARFDGMAVHAPLEVAADPTGDRLDALICAVQAAWAYRQGFTDGGPPHADPLEGWIADPVALARV
jgi:hypothetical protein